ncbi:MAG: YkgJ family cysteine cluster protein, partial [Chitinophagaceae bacterium]|nr:YkgJ family cysteine cluster protein [Chitinophagaceae bacterium]
MMIPVNIRSFKQKVRYNKKSFRRFLGKIERKPPKDLDKLAIEVDRNIWLEMDCLSCANCCKKMSPTYTPADIKRISSHLEMTPKEFK